MARGTRQWLDLVPEHNQAVPVCAGYNLADNGPGRIHLTRCVKMALFALRGDLGVRAPLVALKVTTNMARDWYGTDHQAGLRQ